MNQEFFLSLPFFERALALATVKHAGQLDKGGDPYVMHVIRVMQGVNDPEEKIVALLHDVIEDTDFTMEDLTDFGFPEEIVHGINLLTRDPAEGYMEYIKKLSGDLRAVNVKLSDLNDNQNHSRLKSPMTQKDYDRLDKYRKAEAYLKHVIKRDETNRSED